MSDHSAIEWTEATWNPVVGCSKVSPGCAHCYAETLSLRFGWTPKPWLAEHAAENVILKPERLDQPLCWHKPRMVFVNSMSDLFHENVPVGFIESVFDVMGLAPAHTFQILTKRPERALEFLRDRRWRQFGHSPQMGGSPCFPIIRGEHREEDIPLPNVWIGVSIENARYTWRADVLREIPAAVRFISAEPLLGSLLPCERAAQQMARAYGHETPDEARRAVAAATEHKKVDLDLTGIDWLIVGGESGGRQARPMHPEWARELRDACLYEQLVRGGKGGPAQPWPAFFFKQWGSWSPADAPDHPTASYSLCGDEWMFYRGASPKSGGRLLDGREWNEMPLREAVAA